MKGCASLLYIPQLHFCELATKNLAREIKILFSIISQTKNTRKETKLKKKNAQGYDKCDKHWLKYSKGHVTVDL